MGCSEFFDSVATYGLDYAFEVEVDDTDDDAGMFIPLDRLDIFIPLDKLEEVPSEGDYFSFGPFEGYCSFVDWERREVGMQVDLYD